MSIRVCPCGRRLVQKPRVGDKPAETGKQFADRKYCNAQCSGKYRPRKPAARGFGFEVSHARKNSVGPGFREFIDGAVRPVPR